ncbi:MAG TPA: helix-turn-helix transcriptional regulator [Anaerolineaceae bacterium]|nr:helix-turn-helix transcriptional regulator [Anaerolineaceae bacterium]
MDINEFSTKAAELGAKLRVERELSEISDARAAAQLGVSPEMIESMENGENAPSLPELELLANLYRVRLHKLLGLMEDEEPVFRLPQEKRPAFIVIRTRIIAATLKQARLDSAIPLDDMALKLDVPVSTLEEYESGTLPIPQPMLEKICESLEINPDSLLSPLTPKQRNVAIETETSILPSELNEFVSNPANLPYIHLAKKLSGMEADRLREIAESLLEITY